MSRRINEIAVKRLIIPALSRCPPSLAYPLLELLGDLRYRTARRTRAAIRQRVAEIVGPRIGTPIDEVVRGIFVTRLKARLRELPLSLLSDERFSRTVPIEGREHLDGAVGRAAGVILVGTHLGPGRLICYALRRLGYPLVRVGHRPAGDPSRRCIDERVYAALERRGGARFEDIVLPAVADPAALAGAAKRMRASLLAGNILYLAGDGRATTQPVPVPLFGRPVGFSRAWVSLARMTGAPVIPSFMVSRCRSASFLMRFEPPLPRALLEEPAPRSAISAYVERLEAHVRRFPCNGGPLFVGRSPAQAFDASWNGAFPPLEVG